MDAETIKEKANSADENITFTDDACEALTQVPDFAMDMAINHMVNAAKDQGVDTIDPEFLNANNPMGQTSILVVMGGFEPPTFGL